MKRLWIVVIFFCIVHGAKGDFAVSYEGVDRATVKRLILQNYGVKFDFIDQAAFTAFLAAHRAS